MNLSKNLTKAEFEKSETADKLKINNVMSVSITERARALAVNVFQPIRDRRGSAIKVNSGYRSIELNKKIGGSSTSQHCKGEAIDLPLTKEEFLWVKDNLTYDQLIYEFGDDNQPSWVHISYSTVKNRKQVLRAIKEGGKTKYIPYK